MHTATAKAPAKLPQNTRPQFLSTPLSVTPGRLSISASGQRTKTPVSRSKPSSKSRQKPTGNRIAPTSGCPVLTVMVTANHAASARMAPAMYARITVSRVDMKIFDSPASTILVTNSDGAKYDICGFSQLGNSDSQDDHVCAVERGAVDRNAHRGVLDAAPRHKAEMLLVDRGGDDQLAVQVADDAARKHVRPGERIAIPDCIDFLINSKNGNLLAADQRGHAGVGNDIREAANLHAGIGCPRSSTKATPLSGSSLFTKWR